VGKPRPVVIIQDDRFDATASVTGLPSASSLMVDKITTVPRSRLGNQIGRLDDEDMVRLGRAVLVFLGLAGR